MSNRTRLFHLFICLFVVTALFSPALVLPAAASDTPAPTMVGLPGTHQSELGCSSDWQPDCDKTLLIYDAEDGIWQGTFNITPGNDADKKGPRYKAALNGTWDENYGVNASRGGSDISLVVNAAVDVKFYYDHETHWIADNYNKVIVTAFGDFQQQLGCTNNDDAGCLRSWLEDPDGNGTYTFVTKKLKAETYTVSLAKNEDATNLLAAAQQFTVKADGDEIYFGYDAVKNEFKISTEGAPKGSLSQQSAFWVNTDTLLWNITGSPKYTYSLYYSPEATLELTADGVKNGTEIPLAFLKGGPGGDVFEKNPYLSGFSAFRIESPDTAQLKEALKGQVVILSRDANGKVVDVTGVQIPGVLDSLYTYTGPLGVTFEKGVPTLRLWAPTAQSVKLKLYADAQTVSAQSMVMTEDPATGVWSVAGKADWKNKFYLYEVKVYAPSTGKIETNLVTDPYSFSLSMNSTRSQIVDLNDAALKPDSWDKLKKPALAAPEDIVVYELHVRDFSISDLSVPADLRGTYLAFTVKDSAGMQHLGALAKAGLTHIHLLPAFDIASVNEDKSTWQTVDEAALQAMAPDSDKQAAAVSAIAGSDGFNWGYDPIHYTVPDGAYAADPNGTPRIVEFRQMVAALNGSGLRVVMDVVYNHTTASGQNNNSVLDKIVPGYYYRLDTTGKVTKSTCCENTATEHAMMRKLMIDSVVTWATEYKVDGFRFDLMGHHMLADMQAVRAALDALTLKKDGVDGKSVYIYGEGWDFGEVAGNARGVNASQLNIGGTGIGVFNDRLRDAVRGGGPFDDVRVQGFSTGLSLTPNAHETRTPADQLSKLLDYGDWIKVSLAGNLADIQVTRADGQTVSGAQVLYNGKPAGYTLDPQENIVYVSAHDNETIFDAVQRKAPAAATLADRIRMNNLALSFPMFSQGIPFFHAGDDLLRSKSTDSNSYNSGDWFNKLDWTMTSNNWGVGLPIEGSGAWDIDRPLLANPALKPAQADIQFSAAVFQEMLQIRKSSPLFRLQTAKQVEAAVSFLNTGPDQTPGLIVMHLTDPGKLDKNYKEIVVLFNANPGNITFSDASLKGKTYTLHPVQQASLDPVVRAASFDSAAGTFTVPGRTTAVFVVEKPHTSGPSLALILGIAAAVAVAGLAVFMVVRRGKA